MPPYTPPRMYSRCTFSALLLTWCTGRTNVTSMYTTGLSLSTLLVPSLSQLRVFLGEKRNLRSQKELRTGRKTACFTLFSPSFEEKRGKGRIFPSQIKPRLLTALTLRRGPRGGFKAVSPREEEEKSVRNSVKTSFCFEQKQLFSPSSTL